MGNYFRYKKIHINKDDKDDKDNIDIDKQILQSLSELPNSSIIKQTNENYLLTRKQVYLNGIKKAKQEFVKKLSNDILSATIKMLENKTNKEILPINLYEKCIYNVETKYGTMMLNCSFYYFNDVIKKFQKILKIKGFKLIEHYSDNQCKLILLVD